MWALYLVQEELLAVQEQGQEEQLAEHQLQSLLPPVLAGLKCLVHAQSIALVFC